MIRCFFGFCALFTIFCLSSEAALAHAQDSGIKLLLPTGYYLIGGTLAVAVTVLITALMPARWASGMFRGWILWRGALPRIEIVTSLIGACILTALIWIGFTGTHDPLENLLPLSVWTLWWVALPLLCAVFGNLWALVNPWSGVFALSGGKSILRLPDAVGYAPAIALMFGFAWFENVSLSPEDPEVLARTVGGYVLFTFLAGAVFGWEDWSRRGECFSVFFGFIARLAPIQLSRESDDVTLRVGFPGFAVLDGRAIPISGALFILLALATVSFDGLSKTFTWLGLIGVNPLEFPGRSAVVMPNTIGLILAWIVLAFAFFASIRAGSKDGTAMAGGLALTILPISLAYHVAHYITALMVNGQYAKAALQRLVGMKETHVSTSFLNTVEGVEKIWQAQSGAIVIGHMLAVLLAHAALLRVSENERAAMVRGMPLSLLMVGYTAFGLWLLAAPTGA